MSVRFGDMVDMQMAWMVWDFRRVFVTETSMSGVREAEHVTGVH